MLVGEEPAGVVVGPTGVLVAGGVESDEEEPPGLPALEGGELSMGRLVPTGKLGDVGMPERPGKLGVMGGGTTPVRVVPGGEPGKLGVMGGGITPVMVLSGGEPGYVGVIGGGITPVMVLPGGEPPPVPVGRTYVMVVVPLLEEN